MINDPLEYEIRTQAMNKLLNGEDKDLLRYLELKFRIPLYNLNELQCYSLVIALSIDELKMFHGDKDD